MLPRVEGRLSGSGASPIGREEGVDEGVEADGGRGWAYGMSGAGDRTWGVLRLVGGGGVAYPSGGISCSTIPAARDALRELVGGSRSAFCIAGARSSKLMCPISCVMSLLMLAMSSLICRFSSIRFLCIRT